MLKRRRTAAYVLVAAAFLSLKTAQAGNFFKDSWGVITDPLKLGQSSREISESAHRALIQLTALENITAAHVKERLEEMRTIMKEALSGTESLIQSAAAQMRELEENINRDALNLIYRGQCAAEVAAMSTLQRGFAELIQNLRKADPGIVILGIKLGGIDAKEVEIIEPDKAYLSMKKIMIDNLEKNLKEDTSAFEILSTYQNLSKAARFTRCHYLGSAHELVFTREINDMERLSFPWISVVSIKMGQN